MGTKTQLGWWCIGAAFAALAFIGFPEARAQAPEEIAYRLVVVRGTEKGVSILPGKIRTGHPGDTNTLVYTGDHIETKADTEIALLRENVVIRVRENAKVDLLAPAPAGARWRLRLLEGFTYFFHRGKPTEAEFFSRTATAGSLGTEFTFSNDANDNAIVSVIDGLVELSNNVGRPLRLGNGQRGIASPGQEPAPLPALEARNVIQWFLYYPGVLNADELQLTPAERNALADSLLAYQSGDLRGAVEKYPPGRIPQSDAEGIYRAALRLTVGKVDEAQRLLSAVPRPATADVNSRLAAALEELIAVVKQKPSSSWGPPELATEWMVESYREQSLTHLEAALKAAQRATEKGREFGFAWERVAELEFSFGHRIDSTVALGNALRYSPTNAQAVALNGFLFAAANRIRSATNEFQRAIALDPGLANGWLGLGLGRIRLGDLKGGREDLMVAAAQEPQRAFLRSYLAKALTDSGERSLAEHELELAKGLDQGDPTAWLYSALIKQQNNQINGAIRDLEHSQDLGTNRAVYRSTFKLDEDRAVRSANLAHVYRDAGMIDWSVLEASRGIGLDYANYSAHLFLANSYDELRDPNRINLRYETPAESEYLIANLLAPVGAGTLSQTISQGEYSKLFERNRLSLVSRSEYLSRGAWYENGAQFGTFGNTSYALEGVYRTDPGQHPNNDFYERELRFHFKQQLTPDDTVYLRLVHYQSEGGDRRQIYNPTPQYNPILGTTETEYNPGLRTMERQEPTLTLGYHHQWNPNSHFLITGARFQDTYEEANPLLRFLLRLQGSGNLVRVLDDLPANLDLRSETELYSVEAQQIWETPKNTTIAGARFQTATFNVRNRGFELKDEAASFLSDPFTGATITPILPDVSPHMQRWGLYLYQSFRPVDQLSLHAGIVYDHLRYPENARSVPMSDSELTTERFLPKAGFIWAPDNRTALRGAYTRSLGGASLEQSIRMEPTQVAGFNQAFRSIVPEALVGGNAGARFETYDLALERRFARDTYAAIGAELLYSAIPRTRGAVIQDLVSDPPIVGELSELHDRIGYRERSILASVDQLISSELALGASYRLTDAKFKRDFVESPMIAPSRDDQNSLLHRLEIHGIYNHPCGFFSELQALWYLDQNRSGSILSGGDDAPQIPREEFWQLNAFAGYRFLQRRAQITVGVLNLTDRDYKLNPVVFYNELPHRRTFMARLDLSF